VTGWHRNYAAWYSPVLGRTMEMLVFGHAGARMVVFPTSMGKFYEWEDYGMMAALGEHLANGWLQVFCLDSVDAESWYNRSIHPADRARRHDCYDRYVKDEVLPFTASLNPNPFVITAGASFGAYHAVSFGLRHPDRVGRVLGLSGLYDIKYMTGGYSDDLVYFHNPCDFMLHEHDPARLGALRHQDIVLAVGREDSVRPNNEYLSGLLWSKQVGNALRLWDGWAHDWPWWQDMVVKYAGGHD